MNNNGTINVKSVDSIGIDFSEFNFEPTAGRINTGTLNTTKQTVWGNKGLLNTYVRVGDINVTSIDPSAADATTTRGSYGIRVPNIFNGRTPGKTVDTDAIYYDETIIDGKDGKVKLEGSHNAGISISKIIGGSGFGTDTYSEYTMSPTTGAFASTTYTVGTGNMNVYNYQTGAGSNNPLAIDKGGAGTTHGVTTVKVLDNTGRTADDLIGNIYNLNILVDGKENVGNVGGELVSSLTSLGTGTIVGLHINGVSGSYTPYKATRVPLTVDVNSNLDNPGDAYLKSEFSSSSVTNNAAISGSGAITTPTSLRDKSKLGIAQKNDSGQPRNDVILTNNGTINLSGTGMVGVVGEYTEIYNNGMIRTSGNDSVGILGSNGALAQNNATGTIEIGNSGTGIAAII